ARTIVASGFEHFYETRSGPGPLPGELPSAAIYDDPDAQREFVAASGELERRENGSALWRLFVAGFGAMQVMMYAFPAYIDAGAGTLTREAEQLMRWASLILTTPVILFSAR